MDLFNSYINNESQNNFEFLKDVSIPQGDNEKKFSYPMNSFFNYGGNNTGNQHVNNANTSSGFFSQSNNQPLNNNNFIFTPVSNNYQNSYNFQDSGTEEKAAYRFPFNFSNDNSFEISTFPMQNKQKISEELIENIRQYEEMFVSTTSGLINNPNLIHHQKPMKPGNRNADMNPRQNYNTIQESIEDEENMEHSEYPRDNQNRIREEHNYNQKEFYEENENIRKIHKPRQDEREQFRGRDRFPKERELEQLEPLRKENPIRKNRDLAKNEASNLLGYNTDKQDHESLEISNYPNKNSKKTRNDLIKNINPIQENKKEDGGFRKSANHIDNELINRNNPNPQQNYKFKISDEGAIENYDSYNNNQSYVEKTKRNTKKVSILTDNKRKEALLLEFQKDFQSLNKQLLEKKEKLKMVTNLTKYHEKLYSKIEDLKKKISLFLEKYLESYQKYLENYKLIFSLHDDEIDDFLAEKEERMEKLREKFKF